ncbi:MAG: hypothetical protein L0Y72_17755 [Gemmataceae bacterium]|nr:hypothetical protein [Gemmataceae bacterium]
MTVQGNGEPSYFKIDISGLVARKTKELLEAANVKGIGPEARAALRSILKRIGSDPLGFGEQIQDKKHLRMVVHVACRPPLVVQFAINEEKRFVIIQQIRFLNP